MAGQQKQPAQQNQPQGQGVEQQLTAAGCPADTAKLAAQHFGGGSGFAAAPAAGAPWVSLIIMLAEQLGPVVWDKLKQWLQQQPAPSPSPAP